MDGRQMQPINARKNRTTRGSLHSRVAVHEGAMGKRTPATPRQHGQARTLAHGTQLVRSIICCAALVLLAPMVRSAPSTAPTTSPAPVAYDGSKEGFRLSYPSDWKQKPSQDFTLLLVPSQAPDTKAKDTDLAGSRISVDVPDLPPHLPGMITLGPMEWNYLSDQKKRFADVKVMEKTDLKIPKTSARRLVLAGHAKNADGSAGPAYTVVTLLEIHADRVYLVSAEAKTEDYRAVRVAFDQVVGAMVWTK